MQLIQALKTEQAAATDKRSLLEYVVTFVQRALSYDFAKLKDAKREQRYPYETLYLKKGVCEDKAILLSKLLILLDYKVVLLLFSPANHIAVGLQVPQENAMYRYEDAAYCYVESTDITPIGHIPNQFVDGTRIETPPVIIPLFPNGKKAFAEIKSYTERLSEEQERYGDTYFYAAAEGKKLAEAARYAA